MNPFNKDVKYKKLLDHWQNQFNEQEKWLLEEEDLVKNQNRLRTSLIEEQVHLDKSSARAIEIRESLKELERKKKENQNIIKLIQTGKNTILEESKSIHTYINSALFSLKIE